MAAVDGARYSSGLQELGGKWTYERLNEWLSNPAAVVKDTSMKFAGIRKDGQRADLIAYLAGMSDSPVPFPSAEEAAGAAEEMIEDAAADAQ